MSSKSNETILRFYDQAGKRVFKSESYSYNCGGYAHEMTQMGDNTYEICATFDDDGVITNGESLPDLYADDLASYFSHRQTPAMQKALAIMELTQTPIRKMVMVSVDYVSTRAYFANCNVFTKSGIITAQYDLCANNRNIDWESAEELAQAVEKKGVEGFLSYLDTSDCEA